MRAKADILAMRSLTGLPRRFVKQNMFAWVASRTSMLYLAAHNHNLCTRGSYYNFAGVLDRLAPFLESYHNPSSPGC